MVGGSLRVLRLLPPLKLVIYYGTNERRSVCHALKEKFPHTGHQLVGKYFIVTSYSDTDRRGAEQ